MQFFFSVFCLFFFISAIADGFIYTIAWVFVIYLFCSFLFGGSPPSKPAGKKSAKGQK